MLDINEIRENPEAVRQALLKRMDELDFTDLLQWDKDRRSLIVEVDQLRQRRNEVSAQIPKMKKEGKDTGDIQMGVLRKEIEVQTHCELFSSKLG